MLSNVTRSPLKTKNENSVSSKMSSMSFVDKENTVRGNLLLFKVHFWGFLPRNVIFERVIFVSSPASQSDLHKSPGVQSRAQNLRFRGNVMFKFSHQYMLLQDWCLTTCSICLDRVISGIMFWKLHVKFWRIQSAPTLADLASCVTLSVYFKLTRQSPLMSSRFKWGFVSVCGVATELSLFSHVFWRVTRSCTVAQPLLSI